MSAPITYWEAKEGGFIGYWNEYPDLWTEGDTLADLKRMLISLRSDIAAMIADGTMADTRRCVGELAFA